MKRREKLLCLRRARIEALQRQVATLANMSADVERKLADLEDAIARERLRANDTSIGRLALPNILRIMDGRRDNLQATMKEIRRAGAVVESELAAANEELKCIEAAVRQDSQRLAGAHAPNQRMRVDEMEVTRQLPRQALRQS